MKPLDGFAYPPYMDYKNTVYNLLIFSNIITWNEANEYCQKSGKSNLNQILVRD